ncbi:MAG: fumarate hydratase [Syntrophorhabdales bacterium]
MREIRVAEVSATVERLFIDATINISESVRERLERAIDEEVSPAGKEVLRELLRNAEIARDGQIPLCQDTGLAVVFMEVGQDVLFTGGSLSEGISAGVRNAYDKGNLRKSCCDPFTRENTGDNTPPIVHTSIVAGDKVRIVVMPKGGGSENYSEVRMLAPSQGIPGIMAFVLDMVKRGGPNPCPPIIVGVGVGGNFETSALLSKEALMLPFGEGNPDPAIADLELKMLEEINKLGIGPGGYGGKVTALDVHIKALPCHIASLPVAVNIQCHAHRIREVTL